MKAHNDAADWGPCPGAAGTGAAGSAAELLPVFQPAAGFLVEPAGGGVWREHWIRRQSIPGHPCRRGAAPPGQHVRDALPLAAAGWWRPPARGAALACAHSAAPGLPLRALMRAPIACTPRPHPHTTHAQPGLPHLRRWPAPAGRRGARRDPPEGQCAGARSVGGAARGAAAPGEARGAAARGGGPAALWCTTPSHARPPPRSLLQSHPLPRTAGGSAECRHCATGPQVGLCRRQR